MRMRIIAALHIILHWKSLDELYELCERSSPSARTSLPLILQWGYQNVWRRVIAKPKWGRLTAYYRCKWNGSVLRMYWQLRLPTLGMEELSSVVGWTVQAQRNDPRWYWTLPMGNCGFGDATSESRIASTIWSIRTNPSSYLRYSREKCYRTVRWRSMTISISNYSFLLSASTLTALSLCPQHPRRLPRRKAYLGVIKKTCVKISNVR